MADAERTATIMLKSTLTNGSTPVIVNGRRKDVPHNREVDLTESQLEALSRSRAHNVELVIVSPLAAAKAEPEPEQEPASEAFDAADLVKLTIPKITERLDELTVDQVGEVLEAEKAKGDDARPTLIDLLDKKLAELSAA